MAARNFTLTETWQHVATGAGKATFQSNDHPGEWTIHTTASPVGIIGGFNAEGEKPYQIDLAAGEYLHLRGRGVALVVADTLAP